MGATQAIITRTFGCSCVEVTRVKTSYEDQYLHTLTKSLPDSDIISNEREREMFYLTTHSTHFIYGYMASDIWLRTILIVRKETHCHHTGYSYRQDNTYHGLCYTSHGALAGTRSSATNALVDRQRPGNRTPMEWNGASCLAKSTPSKN